MTVSQFQSGRRQQTQRGVSLIEVLVVLVILVTGILTIIRLFPSGFFSIQSTGNAALANTLGGAAINLGEQDAQSLPESILPGIDLLPTTTAVAAMYSNYDPDDPNNLENARIVSNETVTIPTLVRNQSIYAVKYGPVVMPADPIQSVAGYPNYFTINSPYWKALAGNSAPAAVATASNTVAPPVDIPQDTLTTPGQERFLVDLTRKQIAVPYAAYTADTGTNAGTFTLGNGTVVPNASSYPQKMVLVITCTDNQVYTKYLNVPAATRRESTQPYAPQYVPNASAGDMTLAYLPDTASNYQGGWFDPTMQYGDTNSGTSPQSGETWASVALYRPYAGVLTPVAPAGPAFSNDPYEFALLSGNIGGVNQANPGVVSFNPKAASGSGAQARKAQISYIVYRWDILHEDHDVPALTGSSTFAVRTTVPNLLLAGSANPDNSINPGLAGSNASIVIMDLGTGGIIAPLPASSPNYDPTNSDSPLNNEDLNGTKTGPAYVNGNQIGPSFTNVSYSLGRLTFASDAFGDNSMPNVDPSKAGTAPAHRIRIFYMADLNWAVAVQKAPAYFSLVTPAGAVTGTTPLGASQFAVDTSGPNASVYFARCNAGRTVEIDGTYTLSGTTKEFSNTVAVGQVLNTVGDSDVTVDLTNGNVVNEPVQAGATAIKINAVRGLSARSVVAWKERNVYKVHNVDTILNRTP